MMTDTAVPVVNAGYDGMGAGADWFLWLIVIFALLFNGNGLWGGNGAAGQITNDFLFNNLSNQLGRIQDQNVSLSNGLQQGLCNLGYENLSNFKDLSAQNANCCLAS